ncbi:hypothetical protein EJV46_12465 [Roseococcus sp. SYP-B2431]|uniref:hypothetical protein n=1 Tax=Roseococcus sp. SYP-B2431 TaxID=2496640 RepID=UPI00103B580C|nr:hypothetical protein [Roseococcus sp. SYP-B2431]TCH98018.1 hypothetical protein EJV46_12465 [Roseococcus sp. SYP-B2431]
MSRRRDRAGEGRSWAGPALWALAILPELALGAAAVWLAGRHGPALAAILVNLVVGLRFALTLRPGDVPLITRYARCDRMGLPAECEGYTRRLTAAWALLVAGFALLHGLTLLDAWPMAAVARAQGIAFVLFFLGEHVLRSLVMPQLGLATPWRTFSAIWQASTQRPDRPHAV